MTEDENKVLDSILTGNISIIGKVGSGKSYTAKGLVERLLAGSKRVCILDPTGVYWGLRAGRDGKSPGFNVAIFGGQHADVQINNLSGAAVAGIIASRNLPAVIDVSEMTIGGRQRFARDLFDTLYVKNREMLTLVVGVLSLPYPRYSV